MDQKKLERAKLLYGVTGISKLEKAKIAIFGLGGVGSYAAEALLRSGIGQIDVFDGDQYEDSNFNRQLYATEQTRGIDKVKAFKMHAAEVNSEAVVRAFQKYITPENIQEIQFSDYDYVVEAIDSYSSKIAVILASISASTPIISAMGAGNKRHPELLKIGDIHSTTYCPLAKKIRTELKKRGIRKLKVVYSTEIPIKNPGDTIIGSTSFVPSTMGLMMASVVVNEIVEKSSSV